MFSIDHVFIGQFETRQGQCHAAKEGGGNCVHSDMDSTIVILLLVDGSFPSDMD
jgi:hypothetical protein